MKQHFNTTHSVIDDQPNDMASQMPSTTHEEDNDNPEVTRLKIKLEKLELENNKLKRENNKVNKLKKKMTIKN